MSEKDFLEHIHALLPMPDHAATREWLEYARQLAEDGSCTVESFCAELHDAIRSVKEMFGAEIAQTLYNAEQAGEFCFNPFELPRAARYLYEGKSLEEVRHLARDGYCSTVLNREDPIRKPEKKKRTEVAR